MKSLKINLGQLFKLSLIVIIIPFLFGCSKKLSREEAEKQIKQRLQLPRSEFAAFQNQEKAAVVAVLHWDYHDRLFKVDQVGDQYLENQNYPKSQMFSNLENEGLITIHKERVNVNRNLVYTGATREDYEEYYNAIFTDKAKPFVQGNSVKVATIEFGEVTGIVERKEMKIAEVNYTEKRNNITPFGKAYNTSEETFNRTATFTLYDDGWRIGN